MRQDHHRRLENLYLSAPTNRMHDPTIEVRRGEAQVSITARPEHFHAGGALHGSVLFKVLDDAAFFAANSLVADVLVLTAGFHIHFLRPVTQGLVRAAGRVVSHGRKLLVAEAVAFDEREREVARGSGTFVPSRIALGDLPGYGEAGAKES